MVFGVASLLTHKSIKDKQVANFKVVKNSMFDGLGSMVGMGANLLIPGSGGVVSSLLGTSPNESTGNTSGLSAELKANIQNALNMLAEHGPSFLEQHRAQADLFLSKGWVKQADIDNALAIYQNRKSGVNADDGRFLGIGNLTHTQWWNKYRTYVYFGVPSVLIALYLIIKKPFGNNSKKKK